MKRINKFFTLIFLTFILAGCEAFVPLNNGLALPLCSFDDITSMELSSSSTDDQNSSARVNHPFSAQKLQLTDLDLNQNLVATIDNNCLVEQSPNLSLSIASGSQRHSLLDQQAYTFRYDSSESIDSFREAIDNDPCIVGVTEDVLFQTTAVPNDTNFQDQLHMSNIRASEGWDIFFNNQGGINQDVVVAIIDTGIDYNHPDLANQMWDDGDGNSGRDFVNDDNDPFDDAGHGTHVAGLVGAQTNNNLGIAGIMGSNIKLMGVKVLGADGSGNLANIINGINYAAANNADVINLSLGGRGGPNANVENALVNAVNSGSFLAVSAGNDGEVIDVNDFFYLPAGYAKDIEGMFAVASTDAANRNLSGFSNRSIEYVEIAAPGSNMILSTYLDNTYRNLNGTSMSSPIIAGSVALTLGLFRSNDAIVTPAQLETLMLEGSVVENGLINTVKDGKHLDLLTLGQTVGPLTAGPQVVSQAREQITAPVGSDLQISVSLANDLEAQYQWFYNGTAIDGATAATHSITDAQLSQSGSYEVRIVQFGKEVSVSSELFVVTSCR